MITNQLTTMSETEIDDTIANILDSFDDNERDFRLASEMYNSVFFRDLPPVFRKRTCTALRDHFTNKTNNYWNEQAANQFL